MYKKLVLIMFAVLALGLIQIRSVSAEETLIWTGDIPSDGTPVTTSVVLEAGREYRIVAKEIFWYNYPENLEADAQYYSTIPGDWNWADFQPAPDGHSFLQINGADINWGPFSNGDTGHTYSIFYTGTGAAITFQIVDWIDGDYSNNYCHLPVEIYERPPKYQGLTPGFWRNHLDAWLGYSPEDHWTDYFEDEITIRIGRTTITNPTLLQALMATGGINEKKSVYDALARHAVAALLNAAHPNVDYPMTTTEIINAVNEVIGNADYTDAETLKNTLDAYNNLGGTI